MGRHEDPSSPKDQPLDPNKHKGQGSNDDHQPRPSGKHSGEGKGGKK
ncbi:hypothetical protein [Nonomuraea sp. NPDC050202]|jgi:hypothetical protein